MTIASCSSVTTIQIGDHVTKIKGIRIRDLNHFYQLLRYAPPLLKLTVEREDEPPAPDTPSKDERAQPSVTSSTRANLDLSAIPEERRNSVPRRSGFVYKVGASFCPLPCQLLTAPPPSSL